MHQDSPAIVTKDRRIEVRSTKLRIYRIEIKLVGKPIYQFRVINVTTKSAGILIKDESAFLKMIEVGQIVDADFISPEGSDLSGIYKAEITHITKTDKQEYKGHRLVGISILKKLDYT